MILAVYHILTLKSYSYKKFDRLVGPVSATTRESRWLSTDGRS